MTLQLLEAAVDAVADYLEANMPAKLLTLNTRYSDTLPSIVTYYKGELPQRVPESPSIVIRGSGFTPVLQRAVNIELTYNIDVIVFVGSDDAERRFRMLCRYVVGLVELLRQAQTAAYRIKIAGPVRMTESMATPDFLQGFIISLDVEAVESY